MPDFRRPTIPYAVLRHDRSVRDALIVGLLTMVLVLSPFRASGQSADTQTLRLEQGWNLVSLRVQPADPSLYVLFEGYLDEIAVVKQERGQVYMPSQDVREITTWEADESYKVYAGTTVEVEITGTSLSPGSTPIALSEGWNFIPYLLAEPRAVDLALDPVEQALVRVENEEGNVYSPDESITTLDSLRPGQGYKLYVSQPDTLVYAGKDTIRVETLADALSLKGVEVGQYVRVRGNRGGLFQVTESACEADGGTCFMFEEDLTETTEEFNTNNFDQSANPVDLAHNDLEWRDFEVRYGPDPGDVVTILRLHGHNSHNSNSRDNIIDIKNGIIGHNANNFEDWRTEWGYNNLKYKLTYKYATSDRRLERKNVGNSVNLAWWGAPKANPNNPQTADNHLAWAINVANRIYQNNNYTWTYVDVPGEYYFREYVEMATGVKLRGVGSVNADGFTKGTITWMPGEILFHRKSSYSWQTDSNRKRAYASSMGRHKAVFGEKGIAKTGFEDILLDGNVPNNEQVFDNLGDYDDAPGWLQNSGAWSAFYPVNTFDDNALIEVDDVRIRNMGGSGTPAATNTNGSSPNYRVNNLVIETSRRNHLIYGLSGTINDLTLKGHFWGGNPLSAGAGAGTADATYKNMTITDLEPNPDFLMGGTLTDRRGGITIDGFTFDFKGSTLSDPNNFKILSADDQGTTLKNGTIETLQPGNALNGISGMQLFNQRDISQNFVSENPTTLKNITVTDNGTPLQLFRSANFSYIQDVLFENITVQTANGVSSTSNQAIMQAIMDDRLASEMGKARRVALRGVDYLRPFDSQFRHTLISFALPKSGGTYPMDFFMVDSEFDNQGSSIVRSQNRYFGSAEWEAVRVFMDNVTHPAYSQGLMNPNNTAYSVRLRNCQDGNGRVSDNSGTYTSDAGDEGNDYVLIPTDLMSNAWERSATVVSGAPSVTSIEIANADGTSRSNLEQTDPYLKVNLDQSIGAGNTIEVDWEARVTPLDDYQTTGLFVTRSVSSKSYTSGNGPFTVDLRGVAASQESNEKIVYTASSGDTSVATANVQSDGYTLELTDQGTGTATITVTGEIAGVGTATETFEVSIQ